MLPPTGFFLGRYTDEGNRESALTYDIALFLTGEIGGPVPIIPSRREHFEMVSALEAPSQFLSAYGLFLPSGGRAVTLRTVTPSSRDQLRRSTRN